MCFGRNESPKRREASGTQVSRPRPSGRIAEPVWGREAASGTSDSRPCFNVVRDRRTSLVYQDRPLGGTALANGRHEVKLFEPQAAADAPEAAPFLLLGSLQFSDACLRVYAHPELLRVAQSITRSAPPTRRVPDQHRSALRMQAHSSRHGSGRSGRRDPCAEAPPDNSTIRRVIRRDRTPRMARSSRVRHTP